MTSKDPLPSNPRARLFTPTAVFASTLLFTPLVGGAMAATNWRRLGDPKRARQTALLAAGAMGLMLAVAFLAPDSWESLQRGAMIGATMGAAMGFRNEQRPLFDAHMAAGGAKASPIVPVVLGLLLVGAVLVAVFAGSTP